MDSLRRGPRSIGGGCGHQLALLMVVLSAAIAATGSQLPDHIDNNGPFHLSWNHNQTRWDFIFSPRNITADSVELGSLVNSSNSSALVSCQGQAGCLLKGGKLVQVYKTADFESNRFKFASLNAPSVANSSFNCERSSVSIYNYCSTHWNPPVHITGDACIHAIDWHSPYACHSNHTNHEQPCYVHDQAGKLIDLTHLVRSDGSSYDVDTGSYNKTIKRFHLNICNEAHTPCGPNVSSCRLGGNESVETGYNNLTSIKYDSTDESVHLTSLGQFNKKCVDNRVKTLVKFRCPKQFTRKSEPIIISASDCETVVEWTTVRACPALDIQAPATKCSIKHEPFGIYIDLKEVFSNQTIIKVPDINIDGKKKSMMLGLCQGISQSVHTCGSKKTSTTSACLRNAGSSSKTDGEIVGSITKSSIKLSDNRFYLESFVANKTCQVPVTASFNYTRQVGTRIELVCSGTDERSPRFIGYTECSYIFEWGSTKLCLENMSLPAHEDKASALTPKPAVVPSQNASHVPSTDKPSEGKHSDLDEPAKTAHEMHKDTMADSKSVMAPDVTTKRPAVVVEPPQNIKPIAINGGSTGQEQTKMNKVHKVFMIGLIVMSLTAFVVVIFILDKKTNFKIPLGRIGRRARQAFKPQPVPYTRVSFNDNLDL